MQNGKWPRGGGETGARIRSFGNDGIVDLKEGVVYGVDQPIDAVTGEIGLHATPAVTRDGVVMVGSAIGTISPTHGMATVRKWTFKRRMGNGVQVPDHFEGGIPQGFTWSINGSSPEKVGLAAAFTLTSEEKIEINTVV